MADQQNTPKPQSTEAFTYKITSKPAGCTKYKVGQRLTQYFEPPPPQSITLHYPAPCDPINADLDE